MTFHPTLALTLAGLPVLILLTALAGVCAVGPLARAAEGPPVITNPPADLRVYIGDPASFEVGADGTAPLTYQWLRNGLEIPGATAATYTLATTSLDDQGVGFSVIVSNDLGAATSTVAILLIDPGFVQTNTLTLLPLNATWRYHQAGSDLGTAWRETNYNDQAAGWLSGPGLFDAKYSGGYLSRTVAGETVGTQLSLGPQPTVNNLPTYYFRARFTLPAAEMLSLTLRANVLLDDGAAFYLNGQEVYRLGVDAGAGYATWANRTVGDADYETFEPPAAALVPGTNLLAVEAHQVNATSSDITFGLRLEADVVTRTRDTVAPTLARVVPAPDSTVRTLTYIDLWFSEPVEGVDAADLLVNGAPATNLTYFGPENYRFVFAQPVTGLVQVTWAPSHGIRDQSAASNAFVGQPISYTLDPDANLAVVRINEFLASNKRGLRDEDGDYSDWIELYNFGATTLSLAGWYLTDDPMNLTKWRFPDVPIAARGYLLVWASNKNRTNAAGALHTNFRLSREPGFLALVLPDGSNVVSMFSPTYPQQYDDVSYGSDPVDPSLFGYFAGPTPRALNSTRSVGLGPEVAFSRSSGTFTTPFSLSLALSPASTNYEIRYFLVTNSASANVTNLPAASMPVYTGPLTVTNTLQVRARALPVRSGYFAGPLKTETYFLLNSNAARFSSDVPIVVIHNFAGSGPATEYTQPGAVGFMMVFDTNTPSGRSALTNAPVVTSRVGFHVRGSSTAGYPKKSLAVEAWSEVNFDDNDIEFLGMPADADWAFYAPNYFDQVLIKNPFIHQVARDLAGHYSPRTRFVEMFLNLTGGPITYGATNATGTAMGDYYGVNVVEEKIKRGQDRVDIERVDPEDTNAPAITGGYVLKIDRPGDPDDVNAFSSPTGYTLQESIKFVDPDGLQIRVPVQRNWVIEYFRSFENALRSASFTNPVSGYAAWIDPDNWVETHIVEVLAWNIDGYRLSGYFYKDRTNGVSNGRIRQGPHWDFDRTQGCGGPPNNDNRAFSARQWRRQQSGDQGTDLFGNPSLLGVQWWQRLFNDIDFWQKWIDRWQDLRRTTLTTNNLWAITDTMGAGLREAQVREVQRWGGNGNSDTRPRSGAVTDSGYTHTFPGTYQGELDFHKRWMADRVNFVDTNLLNPPVFNRLGGPTTPGTTLTITTQTREASSTIYYTLDGTDPRLPGGGVAPGALSALNQVTLTVNTNTRVFARNWNATHFNLTNYPGSVGGNPPLSSPWSGPTIATFVTETPPLRITEIMYHPWLPPGDTNDAGSFEYIELTNVGSNTLSLIGFRLTNGVEFTFTATNRVTSLAPEGRVLIVGNYALFVARYPGLSNFVAGEFKGDLDNAGERLALVGPLWEPIHDFRYDNSWYPLTDGYGFSLVVVDEYAPTWAWTNATQWRQSAYDGGSPGGADPLPPTVAPVVVNEVLSASVLPAVDAIELFNPNPFPVDLGHWYLTDNRDRPRKYRLPAGTLIASNGYLVFYETNSFNAPGASNAFALSAAGDDTWVFSGDNVGRLTGYTQGFDFGPAGTNATFGRYTNSVGRVMEVAQSANTLGAPNAYPKVGPVVLNEILFAPPDVFVSGQRQDNGRDEYLELRNVNGAPVPLFDPAHPTNTWRLTAGVDFTFPPGVTLPADGYALVVGFDPLLDTAARAAFEARYGLSNDVPLYGPWAGRLDNAGERVELRRPGEPNPSTGLAPGILVDRLDYGTNAPWPATAVRTGASLQRLYALGFGNDPTNWLAARPSPGREPVSGDPPVIVAHPQPATAVEELTAVFTVTVGGTGPFYYQWLFNGQAIDGAFSATLELTNVSLGQAGDYAVYVLSGSGTALSQPARLTVLAVPVITQPPVSTFGWVGSNVTFRVSAAGSSELAYQWQFYGTNLPGATNSTLVLTNLALWQGGPYRVLVTDVVGTRTSPEAILTLRQPLLILTQPVGQTLAIGDTLHLSVEISGTMPVTYRWRREGSSRVTNVAHTTWSEFTVTNLTTNDAGKYTVVIANADSTGIISSNAFVTVVVPPTNLVVEAGTDVAFNVRAVVPTPAVGLYQWLFQGAALPDATNSTLLLTNVRPAHAGEYAVVVRVTNVAPATFPATLAVVGGDEPMFGLTVDSNATLRFSVPSNTALGVLWKEGVGVGKWTKMFETPSYPTQWTATVGDTLPLAEGRMYVLTNPPPPGPTNPTPLILTSPRNSITDRGEDAGFSVFAIGTGLLRYQWLFNGVPLGGQVSSNLVLEAVTADSMGSYSVELRDDTGNVEVSGPAFLAVRPKVFGIMPEEQQAAVGETVTFEVLVFPELPQRYRWRFNGRPLLNETNETLTIPNVQLTNAGLYSVVVSHLTPLGYVGTISSNAVLNVTPAP